MARQALSGTSILKAMKMKCDQWKKSQAVRQQNIFVIDACRKTQTSDKSRAQGKRSVGFDLARFSCSSLDRKFLMIYE